MVGEAPSEGGLMSGDSRRQEGGKGRGKEDKGKRKGEGEERETEGRRVRACAHA